MTAQIIDGKALAAKVRESLAEAVSRSEVKPRLAVILVGDDEASMVYDRNKQKAAASVGMDCEIFHLPAETTQDELLALVDKFNADKTVNGILVQLPLPQHIDKSAVLARISPEKDVDGFSPYNSGLLSSGAPVELIAATPKAVVSLLQSTGLELRGKHAVIIGRSSIVGRPLISLLLNQDCTVSVVHSKTENIREITRQADFLIAACGCAGLVKKDWVKKGAVVIDVGINRQDGKLCGDVDFEDVRNTVSFITPVPGGVGPMTVAMLLDNTYRAFLAQHRLKK